MDKWKICNDASIHLLFVVVDFMFLIFLYGVTYICYFYSFHFYLLYFCHMWKKFEYYRIILMPFPFSFFFSSLFYFILEKNLREYRHQRCLYLNTGVVKRTSKNSMNTAKVFPFYVSWEQPSERCHRKVSLFCRLYKTVTHFVLES